MKEPFTQIPNHLIKSLMSSKNMSEKTRVLLCIIRKTFGYHKRSDWISLSQFARDCGMKTQNVCRTLKTLKKEGLIIQYEDKHYAINLNNEEWKKLSSSIKIRIDNEDYPDGEYPLSKMRDTIESTNINILQKKKDITVEDESIAEMLLSRICSFNPFLNEKYEFETDYDKWLNETAYYISLLRKKYKAKYGEIRGVIHWIFEIDTFWAQHIISGQKFYEKYEQITSALSQYMKNKRNQEDGLTIPEDL